MKALSLTVLILAACGSMAAAQSLPRADAETPAAQAARLRAEGKTDEAVALLRAFISDESCTDLAALTDAYIALAACYRDSGDDTLALETAGSYFNMRGADSPQMWLIMADAYAHRGQQGDLDRAIRICDSLVQGQTGKLSVSAPACLKLMELLRRRNRPAVGEIGTSNYAPPDCWLAWRIGDDYIRQLRAAGLEQTAAPGDKQLIAAVEACVARSGRSADVQAEEYRHRSLRQP